MVSLILERTSYRFEGVDTWFWKQKRKKEKGGGGGGGGGGGDSHESYRYESCMLLPFSFALVFAFDVCSLILEHLALFVSVFNHSESELYFIYFFGFLTL